MSQHELLSLAPSLLWKHFYDITQIPHPSGSLELIQGHIINFCKKEKLFYKKDDAGNILITKGATKGMQNRQKVILQAHLDMVPQKNSNVSHNFQHDALQPYIDGGWVKAKNTTLGSDNGIGMAACLAILQSAELQHGPIDVLLTADEETGMHGVFGLKKGFLQGDILINTDSEDEGELYVGCAGGIDATAIFHTTWQPSPENYIAYKISITGLLGGHSGVDIHLERANANKLLFRILKQLIRTGHIRLAEVNGGSLRNAIPREAFATVVLSPHYKDTFIELLSNKQTIFNNEFNGIESRITVSYKPVTVPPLVFPEKIQDDIINAVTISPNGVFRHIPQMPEVVETSNNLAIIKTSQTDVSIHCLIRSANDSQKKELCSVFESCFALAGAKVQFNEGYPAWQPNFTSPVLKLMKDIYLQKWGKTPKVKVIHAGLECGIIAALEPHLDLISFGPTIRFPHSPDEKVHIESVQKFWDFLISTLQNISEKNN